MALLSKCLYEFGGKNTYSGDSGNSGEYSPGLLSTNQKAADQQTALVERNVDGRNFIVPSFALKPVLRKKLEWSPLSCVRM